MNAFNKPHVLAYATVAVQEMNLFTFFPHVYWQCAVLSINASANEDDVAAKTTNYGKMAKALGDMQSQGVRIALPDINRAQFGFSPDAETNQIIFGLKAISGIGDDDAAQIIANRPYTSFEDFVTKNSNFGVSTIVSLIKAGAFDVLDARPRDVLMWAYLLLRATIEHPAKDKLNMQNFKSIVSLDLIPPQFDFAKRLTLFRSYTFAKPFMVDKGRYRCDLSARLFFENTLYKFFKEGDDFEYDGDNLILLQKPFEKFYKNAIKEMSEWISDPASGLLAEYNKAVITQAAEDNWDKYCTGTMSSWEMDSLSFYYTRHELANVSNARYNIASFSSIPETPVVIGSNTRKVKDRITGAVKETTWDKYALYRIAGTVLDKNKNKHSITLLTTDGVVTVKFYAEAFAFYDRQISKFDADANKKTVLEKSWFARGNKLLITGIRRGDAFFPKKYNDSIYQHTVCLITNIDSYSGTLELQLERIQQ